jgi:hypothetical protein
MLTQYYEEWLTGRSIATEPVLRGPTLSSTAQNISDIAAETQEKGSGIHQAKIFPHVWTLKLAFHDTWLSISGLLDLHPRKMQPECIVRPLHGNC